LTENLKIIADKTVEFGTPDTYAKFLYLKDREKLNELKNALSAYFLIEQFENSKFDNRALIFLTTILERTIFPGNIKILSWNYDFQLQLAAEIFREERYTSGSGVSVHTPPLIDYFPSLGHDMQMDIKEISMMQLNGIAGSYYNGQSGMYKSFFEKSEERNIDFLLKLLTNDTFIRGSLLTFAWENTIISAKRSEFLKNVIANTDIFVIVGYSFPFFNRKIDKEIFDSMKSNNRLKTIYYQDPYKAGEFLRNQFGLSNEIVIKDIKEVENYFVPPEL